VSRLGSPWLDVDARSLVRRAATIEAAPAAARARVLARVEAVVGSATDGARDTPQPSRGSLLTGGTRGLAIAAAFALGGGLGALVMYRVGHAPPVDARAAPSIERTAPAGLDTPASALSVEPPSTASAAPVAPQPAPPMRVARERPGPDPSSSKASSSNAADPVADERKILDLARGAVEQEDGAGALAATDAHARKYPRGVFVQEREAIAVRALVLLGRTDEARTRVERFRARFPDSLLLPALESTAGASSTP
jgi:hypothetical protein